MFSPANEYKIKLSKVTLQLLSQQRVRAFRRLNSPVNISSSLTPNDVLRSHAQTLSGYVFSASMKHAQPFVLTNEQYICWCLSFLGLPPTNTLGNHAAHPEFDYPVQTCLATHRGQTRHLDADGAHAASFCPAAHAGRMKKHNYLARVIGKAAKEAGLRVTLEPDTHSLLLGEFSKAECRRIFPRHASARYKELFKDVLAALDLVAKPSAQ